MRLKSEETVAIKEVVNAFDKAAKIYLFGSRVEESKRGGDIDLLIDSDKIGLSEIIKIKTKLFIKLGDRKIDIVYKKGTFFEQVKKRAIRL